MTTIETLYRIFLQYPSVQTDSRKIKQGDLFFALKGPHFNGNAYAEQAIRDGAAYAVIDEAEFAIHEKMILVDDVLNALQQLAKHYRLQFDIPFIGITGSNGKTTTKELIYAVLSAKYKTYATEGNLNNHIGVPLTLLHIRPDAEMAIIEMGANHQGEIAAYCQIALPGFGLITNCGKAHLEGFGSLEGVRKAKGELYDFIRETDGVIFRNSDLTYLEDMAQGIAMQVTYGTSDARIIGKSVGEGPLLKAAILNAGMEVQIQSRLAGAFNLPNILAAVAVGHYFHIDIDTIKAAIEQYTPSNSRSQWLQRGDNEVILDAYNANPTSMKLALENLAGIHHGNKWLLLGGMKEMGEASVAEHQALIGQAQKSDLKQVLLCGPEWELTRHPYLWFPDSEALKTYLIENPVHRALILIKGSRGSKMERTLEAL